jgi:hypothetical protein
VSDFTEYANKRLLKPTKWVADTLFVAPGGHRFRNALGLSVGLWIGDKFCNLITGQKLNGDKIDKEDYPAILHPLYGVMSYNRYSDNPEDRWKFISRGLITGTFGAVGAMLGSNDYFKTKNPSIDEQLKNPWHHSKYKITDEELAQYRNIVVNGGHFLEEHQDLKKKVGEWLKFCNPHNLNMHVYNEIADSYLIPAGISALPGSASGLNVTPFPLYPVGLNELFKTRMGYNVAAPGVGKWWSNSAIPDKFSFHYLINEGVNRLSDPKNLDLADKLTQGNLEHRIEDILKGAFEPIYKNLTPDHVQSMKQELLAIRDGVSRELHGKSPAEFEKLFEAESKKVKEALNSITTGTGLNHFMKRHGIDLTKVHFEDHGVSGSIAKWLGSDLRQFTHEYQKALYTQGLHDIKPDELFPLLPKKSKIVNIAKQVGITVGAAGGTGAAAAGVIYAFGGHKHPSDHEFENAANTTQKTGGDIANNVSNQAGGAHASKKSLSGDFVHKLKDMVNGPLLNLSEAAIETFNVPPSGHRLMCAGGLSAMMIIGDSVMKALTGRNMMGEIIKKEQLHPMWHQLFDKKLIQYAGKNSSTYRDQWMHIARVFVPSVFGFFGVLAGSKLFFNDKEQSLKDAKFLDEMDQKAAFTQSGPWTWLAALASFPSSSTGVNLFPSPINYGTALGGRFGLASDRAVLFPGVAEWWSNNHSLYPLQPSGLLKRMAAYGAYNPAQDLKQLDEMVPGILKHWYNNITPAHVQAFEDSFIAMRNDAKKRGLSGKDLEKELLSHVTGQGLEEMLVGIGLNPGDAIIGNNGMSGKIGNVLGAGGKVEKLRETYKKDFEQRRKNPDFKPRDFRHMASPEIDLNLLTQNTPVDISSSPLWAKNTAEKKAFTERDDIKSRTERSNLATMPAKSHSEKAMDSKDNPAVGLTA